MSLRAVAPALVALALLACSTEPGGQLSTTLQGTVRVYETGDPLPGATVSLAEDPSVTTTADNAGGFALTGLTRNNAVRLLVTNPAYRSTINPVTLLGAPTLTVTAYAPSVAFINHQYPTVGLTATGTDAVVVAELEDDLGNLRTGIPLADITLLDASQSPVGQGPFVFGASGDLDNTLTITAEFNNKSRIAFLNVPAGNYTLRVVTDTATLTRPLSATTSGFTLVRR